MEPDARQETKMTTATEMTREIIQNREHRRCNACGKKIMKSRMAFRWANGEVRHPECPAPVVAAPISAPVVVAPVAAAPTYRTFGALAVDAGSFTSWEREYEREGR
jgi:hypothetical protein